MINFARRVIATSKQAVAAAVQLDLSDSVRLTSRVLSGRRGTVATPRWLRRRLPPLIKLRSSQA